MAPSMSANSPFLKQLASSNSQTRQEALESLRLYLSRRARFTDVELLKLWKGLFYCMWMSDRPRAQQRLATDLAALVDNVLSEENVLPFVNVFWQTMAREWVGIDVLRINKFLFLVRQYLAASLRYLAKPSNTWQNSAAIARHIEILSTTPLNPTDSRIRNGLRYHVLDIYVDELDKVDRLEGKSDNETKRSGNLPLEQFLQPIKILQKQSPDKAVRKRATETLEDSRLTSWTGEEPNENDVQGPDSKAVELKDNNDALGEDAWAGIED